MSGYRKDFPPCAQITTGFIVLDFNLVQFLLEGMHFSNAKLDRLKIKTALAACQFVHKLIAGTGLKLRVLPFYYGHFAVAWVLSRRWIYNCLAFESSCATDRKVVAWKSEPCLMHLLEWRRRSEGQLFKVTRPLISFAIILGVPGAWNSFQLQLFVICLMSTSSYTPAISVYITTKRLYELLW